jgi:hypothetical protein
MPYVESIHSCAPTFPLAGYCLCGQLIILCPGMPHLKQGCGGGGGGGGAIIIAIDGPGPICLLGPENCCRRL